MIPDHTPATDDSRSPGRRPWRLVLGDGGGPARSTGITPLDGATNMAVDVALLEAVKAGGAPVLRLYRWEPACLSFGRNQPTWERYDRHAAAERGIDLVRRPTGGQAVLHDDELTYAVIAPVAVIGKPRAAYALINRALVDGLSRLDVRAALAGGGGPGSGPGGRGGAAVVAAAAGGAAGQPSGRGSSGPDWDAACFRRPERGEVVVGGAKLVGSAQRMESRTILQHGSILVGGSQAAAEELLVASRRPDASPSPATSSRTDSSTSSGSGAWTTLERALGRRPSSEEMVAAVRSGFATVLGIDLEPGSLSGSEAAAVARLRSEFASDDWTWRR